MGYSLKEFKLTIRSGRYDLHNLREQIKDSMLDLVAGGDCAAIANFDSTTFAAGPKRILQKKGLQLSDYESGPLLVFEKNTVKYLYENCELTILAENKAIPRVGSLLSELKQRIMDAGGRIEEHQTLIIEGQ